MRCREFSCQRHLNQEILHGSKMADNLKYALEHSQDEGSYPDVFPKDYGMDFHLDENPNWFPMEKHTPRNIILEISSFRGICADAVHYYGTIMADGINICSKGESGHIVSHSGYLGEEFKNLPKEKQDSYHGQYKIHVARILTEEEYNNDPNRWEFYYPGCKVTAFDSVSEIEKIAKVIVSARFPEGYTKMIVKHNYYDV